MSRRITSQKKLDALEGLITADVGECLRTLASAVPTEQHVVEIGAWKGKSTCYLAAGRFAGDGGHVYSVDTWSTDVQEWSRYHQSATLEEWSAQVRDAGYLDYVTPLQGRSVEVAAQWTYGPIGLLFIDGDHSRDAVLTDWRVWRPHLTDSAVVVFDDYGVSHNPDVAPVVRELQESGSLQDLQITAGDRIAVCRVSM